MSLFRKDRANFFPQSRADFVDEASFTRMNMIHGIYEGSNRPSKQAKIRAKRAKIAASIIAALPERKKI